MAPMSCDKCGGLIADWFDGDRICVVCGRVFYSRPPARRAPLPGPDRAPLQKHGWHKRVLTPR